MSGSVGLIRKVYDVVPAALVATGDYDGVTNASTTSYSAGLASIWLSQMSQSVNDNGRVGQSIAVDSLDLRCQITPDNSIVGHAHYRMILFADNECDGTTPAFSDLLGDTGGSATSIATGLILSFLQPAYLGRFNILFDKHMTWYNSSTANSFEQSRGDPLVFESHHDMGGHRIMWDTTDSSAIGNARKGHIFLFILFQNQTTITGGLVSDGANPGVTLLTTANPPALQYTARFRFRDA